jgi:hypothetical protein
MKVEIKGIDLNTEKMRFYPVMLGIMEVVKSKKGKQGYIKLHLPDEMLNDLMMMSLNMNEKAIYEQYLVSCRVKE